MLSPLPASGWATSPPPPREWLVPGLVPMGAVTLLSGDGGVGKSALAKQLSLSCALGANWLGRRVIGGPVIGLYAEDDEDECGRRLIRIAAGERLDLAAASDLLIIASEQLHSGAALATSSEGKVSRTALFEQLAQLVDEVRPALIVLDPAAEIAGIDENRRSEVAAFMRLLNGLAASSGAAIVLISHPSLTGMNSGSGLSGSTAWNNSVRSRLYLTAPDQNDPDARRLALVKSNYARSGVSIDLRIADGRFVAVASATSAEARETEVKVEAVFLAILRRMTAERRPLSASASATYAPAIMAKEPEAKGIDKAALQAAMSRLFKSGRIVIEEDGPPSKRRQRIVETPSHGGANHPTDDLPTDYQGDEFGASNAPTNPPANALPTPSNRLPSNPPYTPREVGTGWEVGNEPVSDQRASDRGSEGRRSETGPDEGDWASAWAGADDAPDGWAAEAVWSEAAE